MVHPPECGVAKQLINFTIKHSEWPNNQRGPAIPSAITAKMTQRTE